MDLPLQGVWALAGRGAFSVFAYYLWKNFTDAQGHRIEGDLCNGDGASELEEADPDLATWKIAVFLILGLAGLLRGGSFGR